ncbi:hypothetical protein [Corynebacterium aquilae]|uniref:Uncharacterized protein n=1 Tax=Corynebacterium aquilae DSM 44791 TaxID=1431546 RepID=A0A1L7CH36_9CORY|nr:hypothetical protein [Corynebacterium aquilae]APT85181.1 hypothetical protein CAQU_08980 [Corynebacterium aquilae DSM 44791]
MNSQNDSHSGCADCGGFHTPTTPVLEGKIASKTEFFRALYAATVLPLGQPTNYDALADYCRELKKAGVVRVDAPTANLPLSDTVILCEIFREAGVGLKLA